MNDKRRQEMEERFTDAALSLLLDDYAEAEGERLMQEYLQAKAEGRAPEPSPELDKRCLGLIDQVLAQKRRRERMARAMRQIGKVAACLLAVLSVCTMLSLSVDAFRSPVLNFFLHPEAKYSTVEFSEPDKSTDMEETSIFAEFLDHMPDGYEIVKQEAASNDVRNITCKNKAGMTIIFNAEAASGEHIIDTEDAGQVEIELSGRHAMFLAKDGCRLVWFDDNIGVIFTLSADGLTQEAFLELAAILTK